MKNNIQEIIRADDKTVKALNLTHETIAARMSFFRDESKKGLGMPVRVAPHFEARCDSERGLLSCPFGEPGAHRKTNVTVRNLRLGKEVAFSDLNIHLIAAHGCYEAKGSAFRLEPEILAEVLEIRR